MLNVNQAKTIVKNNIPNGKIQAVVVYGDLYIFQVFTDDELEGQMDPFYSVDIKTGEFRDFSIITDGDINILTELFLQAKTVSKGIS